MALRSAFSGSLLRALDRYIQAPDRIESRWLALRVLGIAGAAVLFDRYLPMSGVALHASAVVCVLIAYGLPAELGMVIVRRMPDHALPYLLKVLRPFELLGAPLALPLVFVGNLVGRFVQKPPPPSASLAESEVEILVNEGEQNGSLAHDQSEMIRNVLDFREVRARDVMVPRTHVVALDVNTPGEEVLRVASENTHSRYPVYRDRIDNVIGILHVKDLINYAVSHDLKQLKVEDVIRTPVVFIPESQSASSVLRDMRSGRRHHMAVIIDEFGGMSGVVTLEDLIEEIVGDIRDEHDGEGAPFIEIDEGRLLADAGVSLADLSRFLDIQFPEEGGFHSLGGLIVERLGKVPEVGAKVSAYGFDFVVHAADERHVSKVEVIRTAKPETLAPRSSRRSSAAA